MKTFFSVIQVVISILLIIAIVLQNRGTGLGSAFGGTGNVYRTKRGMEKFLFWASIVLATLFMGVSFARVVLY